MLLLRILLILLDLHLDDMQPLTTISTYRHYDLLAALIVTPAFRKVFIKGVLSRRVNSSNLGPFHTKIHPVCLLVFVCLFFVPFSFCCFRRAGGFGDRRGGPHRTRAPVPVVRRLGQPRRRLQVGSVRRKFWFLRVDLTACLLAYGAPPCCLACRRVQINTVFTYHSSRVSRN